MKYQTTIAYLVIPLAFLSILSLFDNVQAQTNSSSTSQSKSSQQQQMNMTAQALMKTDIDELQDTLTKAKLAIIEDNLKGALQDVRDVETQILLIEPAPTKLLSSIHKAINALARSDIDKSLDTLTNIQVTILKAENQIFKATVANPEGVQQFINTEKNNDEDDSTEIEDT